MHSLTHTHSLDEQGKRHIDLSGAVQYFYDNINKKLEMGNSWKEGMTCTVTTLTR